jgi:hypothetical protein
MRETQLLVGVASVVAGIGLLLRSEWIAGVLIGDGEGGLARDPANDWTSGDVNGVSLGWVILPRRRAR